MKYEFKRIYTSGMGNWNSQMDEAGEKGFRVVAWMPWDGNHVIIMEREVKL